MDETSMDIFLLKQLFRSNVKAHERTALEILISNFDQRSRIRQFLEGAELLVEDLFRERYKKLKMLYNRLRVRVLLSRPFNLRFCSIHAAG